MTSRSIIITTTLLSLSVGLGLIALGLSKSGNQLDQIWYDLAKSGIQLVVISVIGGGVTAALKYLDTVRDEQRRLNEYRLSVLRTVTHSYNKLKAVRRELRALGLRSVRAEGLSSEQAGKFHVLMSSLNEAQLALEHISRELHAYPKMFSEQETLQESLQIVREYMHDRNWSQGHFLTGDTRRNWLRYLQHWRRYLGTANIPDTRSAY